MEPWQLGLIGGVTATLAVIVSQRRAKKEGYDRVLPILQQRGPSTIPELMDALGVKGFSAQGKITMELGALVRDGRVEELPVPEGTPQLQKIKVRQYRAKT